MHLIKDKKGQSYLQVCVLIVIFSMLASVFLTFTSAVGVVRMVQSNARIVLDNYVITNSIEIYDSIKQGSDRNDTLDSSAYRTSLSSFCTFAKDGNYYYNTDNEGKMLYYISSPSLSYSEDHSLKIHTEFTLFLPIHFAGVRVGTAEIPLKISSKLIEKF